MKFYLNSEEITDNIEQGSFSLDKSITDQMDSGSFSSMDKRPKVSDIIEIYEDDERIFRGFVTNVSMSFDGATPNYDIDFVDNTLEMDQKFVIERFEDKTVKEIAEYVRDFSLPEGYDVEIDSTLEISEIVFNYKKPSEVFEELADIINYEWRLDEDKVVRFFQKGEIDDTIRVSPDDDIVFWETITYEEDIEELKNRIFVKGGRRTSTEDIKQNMNEQIDGSNDILKTGYTYIFRRDDDNKVIEPVLKLDGVEQEIGIENEESFDSTKAELTTDKIRFEAEEAGTDGNDISVEFLIDDPNQELSVSVTDKKISVYLESNYQEEPRSTAQEVVDAINDDTDASDLVSVSLVSLGGGDDIIKTMEETFLEDGTDGMKFLYNQEEKLIKCESPLEEGDKPVTLEGRIRTPIEAVLEDSESQEKYNLTVEHLIKDDSIASFDEAENKAKVELEKFAEKLDSGKFQTHNNGFIPGKSFRMIIPEFDVDNYFTVRKVSIEDDGGGKFRYKVSYTTQRSKQLLDLLKQLVKSQRHVEETSDILSKIANTFEEIEIDFNVTEHPFDGDEITWVAGPYFPDSNEDTTRCPRAGGGAKAS